MGGYYLPVDIREGHAVGVHKLDMADARTGKGLCRIATDTTDAKDDNAGVTKPPHTLGAEHHLGTGMLIFHTYIHFLHYFPK